MDAAFLSRWSARHPRLVIAAHLVLLAVALVGFLRLRETDDVLEFIPPGDPDIQVFNQVNDRFGALRVALIGVEAPAGDDVFAPETLKRIAAATESLKSIRGVDRVLSLSSLVDFTPSAEMVQVRPLIEQPPATPEERKALRERVLSRPHVAGSFISKDGRAALLLVFLAPPKPGEPPPPLRGIANQLRAAAEEKLAPDLHTTYGGAPFAAATIFDETQEDIRRLTPLALLFILAVILFAFRDPVGVALTVFTIAWAALLVAGGMGFLGEPYTVVSSTLPVILFASGSSYAVHVLGRYYALGGRDAGPGAIVEAARIVSPPVLIAGCTTSAGFLSFLVMNIRPMRTFGVECAAGVVLTVLAALTLVPAVIALWPRPPVPPARLGPIGEILARLGDWARRSRVLILSLSVLAAVATVKPMFDVEVRMEPSSFFRPGSEPWKSERFLDERFGGAHFLQVWLRGPMTDPNVLRELKRLVQFSLAQPGATQVQSIVDPFELVSDAMGSGLRLPETREQAQNLLFFVEGEPSLRMLLSPERDSALVHVRIRGDAQPAMAALEKYLGEKLHAQPGPPTPADVAERIGWIAAARGVKATDAEIGAVTSIAKLPDFSEPELRAALRDTTLRLLGGEGGVMPPVSDAATRERIADLVIAAPEAHADKADAGPAHDAFVAAAPSPEEADLAWRALRERLSDRRRRLAVDRAIAPIAARFDPAALAQVKDALLDLFPIASSNVSGTAPGPAPTLTAKLAGEPVLDRGLSRSVAENQTRSLIVSIIAVLAFMFLLFRSLRLSVLSVFPSALTLAITFGAMGLLGVRIDIGTSLVASIATGAGADFAMHYIWYVTRVSGSGRSAHDEVARFVGPIMLISTVLVALGFAVLGLGKAQPMRMFGTLAAGSMTLAAALTFLLVPALVNTVDRDQPPPAPEKP